MNSSAALTQARGEWKKAYDKDAKKGGFGAIAQYSVAKLIGKGVHTNQEKDSNDVRLECLEQFKIMDVDQSGSIDRKEIDVIDTWWSSLSLVDALGIEIPAEAYTQAKNDMFGDVWTLDFDDFAACFHEVHAVESTEISDAVKGKQLTEFQLAVREAIIAARPEEDVVEVSSLNSDDFLLRSDGLCTEK